MEKFVLKITDVTIAILLIIILVIIAYNMSDKLAKKYMWYSNDERLQVKEIIEKVKMAITDINYTVDRAVSVGVQTGKFVRCYISMMIMRQKNV